MLLEENKAIVRSIFEDGLNKGEVDKFAEMTAPDFFDHDIHVETGIPAGPRDLREALVAICRGFPDIDVTIEDIIAEGGDVVVRNTWRAPGRVQRYTRHGQADRDQRDSQLAHRERQDCRALGAPQCRFYFCS